MLAPVLSVAPPLAASTTSVAVARGPRGLLTFSRRRKLRSKFCRGVRAWLLGTEVVVPARAGKNPLTMRRLQLRTKTFDYVIMQKGLRIFILR